MSARSIRVWHACAWGPCGRRFHPYGRTDRYCCHRHYALARRREPGVRFCALGACGRPFLVGGTTHRGRRRPDVEQRFHSRSCASRARERVRVRTQLNTTLTPRSRAALAAALDGEGWVSRNAWVIELGNTSLPWLRRLRAIAGGAGSIREDRGRTRPAHWKRFWRWRVYGQSAYALLLACLPELTVKRVRADAFVRSYRARADA